MTVTIYTDGGARGNPGPAGAGAVVYDGEKQVARVSKFLGNQTNNWAEYQALILALDAARHACSSPAPRTEVRMDSELIVKQMKGEYKVKDAELKKQHARVKDIIAASFPDISFTHVRREHNTEADALANDAMDRGR